MAGRHDSRLWLEAREYAPSLAALALFSGIITFLNFVPIIFMHQLFERVITSRNSGTLAALAVIVLFLTAVWVAIELARVKTLQRVAIALDEKISPLVFDALNRQTDRMGPTKRAMVLQDLNIVRDFVSGHIVIQFFDFLFVPVLIIGAALFHPIMGIALLILTIVVAILAALSQLRARDDIRRSVEASMTANEFGRAVMNNAESIRPQGMLPAMGSLWRERQREAIGWQYSAMMRSDPYTTTLRYLRHLYAPILLTVGMLLFLNEMVGAGVIFATVLLGPRAVGPVDAIASSWRVIWNAVLSSARIDEVLKESARRTPKVALPAPNGPLVVTRIAAAPPNRDAATLMDVSFRVQPGEAVAVVGASGAGKSTLARVLTGAWPIQRGSITLDGHELAHWDQDQLGAHIGYVAQDVELLPGTVAANISRFEPAGPETTRKLIDAIRITGVQDIISKLSDGLNTRLGPGGHTLSSGQRQRIALARAVYGSPQLVVLDEPNSNLDSTGEQQLAATIGKLKEYGAIVILVTHRMNMLTYCDNVLVINAGTVQAYGARDHVLDRLSAYRPKPLLENRSDQGRPDAAA